jgi:hypothetical protein
MNQDWEKIKNNWEKTSECKLGITFEEALELRKDFEKELKDVVTEDGIISDYTVINALFPDLTKKQKFMILYYSRWIMNTNLKTQPI